jgi:predicted nucleic acid-binding protein
MAHPQHAIALDSCSLLNLFASRRFPAIAAAMAHPFVIADRVQAEALYVRRGGSADDANERELVDTAVLVAAQVLTVVSLSPEEMNAFVLFAAEVDDGEAATAALALNCGYDVVTDDGKALRLLRAHVSYVHHYSTLEVLKLWADRNKVDAAELHAVLVAVRDRANFLPPRRDPLRAWAEAILATPPAST